MGADLAITYEDWHAVHDHMGKTLHISGVCVIEGGGFAVHLEEHTPQGFNPEVLVLDLVIVPTGETPSRVPVEWRQPWGEDGIQYKQVSFEPRGPGAAPPPTLDIEDAR
jgi:hypothetical protein